MGRRKVSRWTINGLQEYSRTSWTWPEHRPGTNGKRTERLRISPFLRVHKDRLSHHHRRRRRRGKLVPLLSSHDSVAVSLWNMGGEAHPTDISYIVPRISLYITGPSAILLSASPKPMGCKLYPRTRVQSPSTPPLLLLLFTASLCLRFQSRVKSPLASSHLFTISSLPSVR